MKKQLLLIIALLFCLFTYAQITIDKKSNKSLDEMIKNLDKTDFTSGVLLDRSGNFSKIEQFNTKENDKPSDFTHFKQTLLDLYNASNKNKFISYVNFKKRLTSLKIMKNEVVLGIINADFEVLNFNKSDSKSSGLILKNQSFKVKKGRKVFLSHHSIVVSPLKTAVKGNKIKFHFKRDYFFNDSKEQIESLTISFDNKSKIEVIKDNNISNSFVEYQYKKSGIKTLHIVAKFKSGKTLKFTSELYVIIPDNSNRNQSPCLGGVIENGTVYSDILFQGYDETSPIYGQIDYRIYFRENGNTSNTLMKPIIIIDGFDPQDLRKIEDIDCQQDSDCAGNGANVFTGTNTFSSLKHRSIFDLMQPINTTKCEENLIPILRNLGYDVVIVNHPTYEVGGKEIDGGADYIERNALTLTRLIRDINKKISDNNSNEQLVIVGPSMGGQISRYALAYMEKEYEETDDPKWKHNTRLWVSVDSPHLGANIPMGVQSLINLAKDQSPQAQDFADNQLGSAAARQQLIEQYSGHHLHQLLDDKMDNKTVSQGYSTSRGSIFFQNFYDNLFNNGLPNSKGYPQNLRKIALVNGSMSGSRTYENPWTRNPNDTFAYPNEETVHIKGFQNTPIFGPVHIVTLKSFAMPNTGQNTLISKFGIPLSETLLYTTNSNSRGNMDNAPGGWFPAQFTLAESSTAGPPVNVHGGFLSSYENARDNVIAGITTILGGNYWEVRKLKHASSFISSFSAIGHTSPNTNWSQALNKNLVCQNLTPFDSYFGHDKNTSHTSFHEDSSIPWLLAELEGNALEPYFPISVNNLVGPDLMCNSLTQTYTFNHCSTPGDVANWEVSGAFQIVSSTSNSITVRTPRVGGGKNWIKATFNNGATVKKDIWVGKAYPDFVSFHNDLGETDYFCTSHNGNSYKISPKFSEFFGTSHQIRLRQYPNLNVVYSPSTNFIGNTGTLNYTPSPGWYLFEVRINNPCGPSEWVGNEVLFMDCSHSGGGGEEDESNFFERSNRGKEKHPVKIYPVPTKNLLNIEYKTKKHERIVSIELFDHFGRLVLQEKTTSSNLSINTAKLKDGNYILKITTTEQTLNRKIMIQR